ncbi:unnamed protein product [Urochloa humidicola]
MAESALGAAAAGSRDDDGFWEQFLRDDNDDSPAPEADLTGNNPSWASPERREDLRRVFARGWTTPTEPAVRSMCQSSMEARAAPGGGGGGVNDSFWEQFLLDDDSSRGLVLPAADPTVDYAAMLDSVEEEAPAVSESDDEQLLELTLLTTASSPSTRGARERDRRHRRQVSSSTIRPALIK